VSEEALERAIADACLGAGAGRELTADLAAFLEARGVSRADVEAILQAPRRLAVYRSLVRNGLSMVVLRMLPRTRARLNAACGGRFDSDFAAFVDEKGPATHYLRDVPFEFVEWVGARWGADATVPAYIPDLARHELAFFEVASAGAVPGAGEADGTSPTPPGRGRNMGEVALDRPLAFHESTRLVEYAWAVHELSSSEEDTEEPSPRDVRLLAYRDPEHDVRWLELTPLAAAILSRLVAGATLAAAVEGACGDSGVAPAAVLNDVARLLADMGSRGVILGARG
jgi:hypothetical protein